MTTTNQEFYKLTKNITHRKFKKDLKALNWYFRDQHKVFVKINDNRISITHEYICNLLLKKTNWNKKLLQNKYLMFILDAEAFRWFLEEEKGLKDKELGKYFLSFVRLTDKFLISHMLLDKLTKKNISVINEDLQKWFKISYKKKDYLFKDYCDLVSYLIKQNKIHGTIKTEKDFNDLLEIREMKKKFKREQLSKYYDEPKIDWF
jgi:hypothetical protein